MAEQGAVDRVEIKYGEQLLPLIAHGEGGHAGARSNRGALGKNQILPSTARDYGFTDVARLRDDDAYNDQASKYILNDLWKRLRDPRAVLIAYNAGARVARTWLRSGKKGPIPDETVDYVTKIEKFLNVGGQPLPPLEPEQADYVIDTPFRKESAALPEGMRELDKMRRDGSTAEDLQKHKAYETKKFLQNGFTMGQVDKYFGDDEPDMTPLDSLIRDNFKNVDPASAPKAAENIVDQFKAGLGSTAIGMAMAGRKPEYALPENAGLGAKLTQATGQLVGDLPLAITGFVAGAAAAAPAAPETLGVASLVAGGFASGALPQAAREAMMDYFDRGQVVTGRDFVQMVGSSLWRTAKAGLANAVGAPLGPLAGKAAGPIAGNAMGEVANIGATTAGTLAAQSALEGQLPDKDSALIATILAFGTYGGVKVASMDRGGKPSEGLPPGTAEMVGPDGRPTKTAFNVAGKMDDIYRTTGATPWEVAEAAKGDIVIRQEILAEDLHGNPVTPKLLSLTQEPAPFEGAKKTEIVKPAEDGGGKGPPPVDDVTPPAQGPKKIEGAPKLTPDQLFDISAEFVGIAPKAKSKTFLDHYTDWFSILAPLRRIDDILLSKGILKDRDAQMGLEDMGRQTFASQARVGNEYEYGPVDPINFERRTYQNPETGKMVKVPPAKDAVDLAKKEGNVRDWVSYMVAQRANKLEERGFELSHPLDAAQRSEMIAAGDKKYAKATGMLQRWFDAKLDYGRESGIFSARQVEAMRRENPVYVKFSYITGEEKPLPRNGMGFKVREPVKRYTGGEGQIENPLGTSLRNAALITQMADRNRLVGSFISLAETNGFAAEFGLKRIDPPELKMAIAEPGSDTFIPYDPNNPTGETYSPFLAMRLQRNGAFGNDTFLYFRDGKPEVWKAADEALVRALRGAETMGEIRGIEKLFRGFASFQRAGIVNAPDFSLRNMLRDGFQAFVLDPHHPLPFVTWLQGAFDMFGKTPKYQDWAAKGGMGASIVEMDLIHIEKSLASIYDKTGTYDGAWNTFKHPVELATWVRERAQAYQQIMDGPLRIGYMKQLEAKGIDPIKAATMSRKASLDFTEHGALALAQRAARVIPFFNPSLLSLKQWGEALNKSWTDVAKYGIAGITSLAITAYLMNWFQDEFGDLPEVEKFRNRPRVEKDTYILFPQMGNIRPRLQMPPILGPLFAGLPVRFLDYFAQEDPEAFKNWGQTFLKSILPPMVPTLVVPPFEHFTNTNFYSGQPLIPSSLEDISGQYQYTDSTTEVGKKLSQWLNPLNVDVSPIVIDNYVRDYLGTIGINILRALDVPLRQAPGKPWEYEDLPFVGSFLSRNPRLNAQPLQDFYRLKDEIDKTVGDFGVTRRRLITGAVGPGTLNEALAALMPGAPMNNIAKVLGRMRQDVVEINNHTGLTNAEKIRRTDAAYGNMIIIARRGIEVAHQIKKMKAAQEPKLTSDQALRGAGR